MSNSFDTTTFDQAFPGLSSLTAAEQVATLLSWFTGVPGSPEQWIALQTQIAAASADATIQAANLTTRMQRYFWMSPGERTTDWRDLQASALNSPLPASIPMNEALRGFNAWAWVDSAKARGITVSIDGSNIRLAPASKLTVADTATATANKAAILAWASRDFFEI